MPGPGNLVRTAGTEAWDDVRLVGGQIVAVQEALGLSLHTGSPGEYLFDSIACFDVCKVHILVRTIAGVNATPNLRVEFGHKYSPSGSIGDRHRIIATHHLETLNAGDPYDVTVPDPGLDLGIPELTGGGNTQTLTVIPSVEENGAAVTLPIWNKSECRLRIENILAGETYAGAFTLVITDLRRHFGLI